MKIAYILTVHKQVPQVVRLLDRLAADDVRFVVHVDRRAGEEAAAELARRTRHLEISFVERNPCFWGGFGHVRGAFKGIAELVERDLPFDYAVLLSGQDYPLVSPARIEATLAAADGRSFLRHAAMPAPWWGPQQLGRFEKWHLVSYKALHLRLPWKRRIPGGLAPYGGEGWWIFSRPVAEYVHAFIRANLRFVRFFERTLHPAELFFHTIVMNSPHAGEIVDDHLRYIDWFTDPGPKILTADDYDELVSSGKLFARKFDITVDGRILDLLDAHIEHELGAARA